MAVQVLKSMSVHKAVVLGFLMALAARCYCPANEFIHLLPALRGQTHEHFRACCRITDLFRSKRLEFRLGQEHHEDIVRYHHASGGFIGELSIELESKTGKELHGFFETADRKIDKDFCSHVLLLLNVSSSNAFLSASIVAAGPHQRLEQSGCRGAPRPEDRLIVPRDEPSQRILRGPAFLDHALAFFFLSAQR